jgi:hypothetical protein
LKKESPPNLAVNDHDDFMGKMNGDIRRDLRDDDNLKLDIMAVP